MPRFGNCRLTFNAVLDMHIDSLQRILLIRASTSSRCMRRAPYSRHAWALATAHWRSEMETRCFGFGLGRTQNMTSCCDPYSDTVPDDAMDQSGFDGGAAGRGR